MRKNSERNELRPYLTFQIAFHDLCKFYSLTQELSTFVINKIWDETGSCGCSLVRREMATSGPEGAILTDYKFRSDTEL